MEDVMFAEFFESPLCIGKLRDGSQGRLLQSFAQELCQAGYVVITARRHIRAAEHFIYWTDQEVALVSLGTNGPLKILPTIWIDAGARDLAFVIMHAQLILELRLWCTTKSEISETLIALGKIGPSREHVMRNLRT